MAKPKIPTDPLPPELQQLLADYEQLQALQARILTVFIEWQEKNIDHHVDEKDESWYVNACDYGYLAREIGKIAKEMQVEADGRSAVAGRHIAQNRTAQVLARSGDDDDLNIQARLCSGSPDVGETVFPPKKGTPEYIQLCQHLKIPQEAIDSNTIEFHWKHISTYFAELCANGRDGEVRQFVKTSPAYKTVFHTRKKSVPKPQTETETAQ